LLKKKGLWAQGFPCQARLVTGLSLPVGPASDPPGASHVFGPTLAISRVIFFRWISPRAYLPTLCPIRQRKAPPPGPIISLFGAFFSPGGNPKEGEKKKKNPALEKKLGNNNRGGGPVHLGPPPGGLLGCFPNKKISSSEKRLGLVAMGSAGGDPPPGRGPGKNPHLGRSFLTETLGEGGATPP